MSGEPSSWGATSDAKADRGILVPWFTASVTCTVSPTFCTFVTDPTFTPSTSTAAPVKRPGALEYTTLTGYVGVPFVTWTPIITPATMTTAATANVKGLDLRMRRMPITSPHPAAG